MSFFKKILRTLFSQLSYRNQKILLLKWKDLNGLSPIVIYQMGKVGSSTVYSTAKTQLKNQVFHVHFLTPTEISKVEAKYRMANVNLNSPHLLESRFLSLVFWKLKVKWNIITLVREPISCALSHLFHNPRVHHAYLFDEKGTLNKARALEVAHSVLMKYDPTSHYEHIWIGQEFNVFLDFDLYEVPFDTKKGYALFEAPHFKLLVLQMESINECLNEALQEMKVVQGNVPIVKANENVNKEFSEVYGFVKNNLKLPRDKVNEIYSSKYARHFYDEDFISAQVNRWSI